MPTAIFPCKLAAAMNAPDAPQVIDVRRKPAFDAGETMIHGAAWHDPEDIERWMFELDSSRNVAVYCVHGHQVSQGCATRLERAGFRAAYLGGGFEQWVAEDLPTINKL